LAPARRSRVLKLPILKTEKSRSPRRLKPLASVGVTAGARSVTSRLNSGSGATMSEIAFAWKVEVDFLGVLARCLIIRRTMCSCLRTPWSMDGSLVNSAPGFLWVRLATIFHRQASMRKVKKRESMKLEITRILS